MKLLFLDIDGTMNCLASVQLVMESDGYEKGKTNLFRAFAPWSLAALTRILEETGAQIVISSSWGHTAIPVLQEQGISAPILGVTPYLNHKQGEIWVAHTRGQEIAAFIENFTALQADATRFVVSHICILDDDGDMGDLCPALVQTEHGERGLTDEHAERAIAMLNGEPNWPVKKR